MSEKDDNTIDNIDNNEEIPQIEPPNLKNQYRKKNWNN